MTPLKSFISFLFLLCFLTEVSAHLITSSFSDKVRKDFFLSGIGIALRTDINIGNSNKNNIKKEKHENLNQIGSTLTL